MNYNKFATNEEAQMAQRMEFLLKDVKKALNQEGYNTEYYEELNMVEGDVDATYDFDTNTITIIVRDIPITKKALHKMPIMCKLKIINE